MSVKGLAMDTVDSDGLQQIGCAVLHSKVDRSGVTVYLVRTSDGRCVAMLQSDIDEMIDGRAMVHKIIQRDRAANLEAPWPNLTRRWPPSERPESMRDDRPWGGASSFDYVRDDACRRIRITARERLQSADLIAIIDRQAREETWAYGVLYDLRAINTITPAAQTSAAAEHVRNQVRLHGPRGPVALITWHLDIIGIAQMYAFLGSRAGFTGEVFWDLEEAERWLDKCGPSL